MVKNEADIVEQAVRHLISQGVDQVFIVDNGSSDGTRELLESLSGELPLLVGRDDEVGYYQSHKMTALAGYARRHGAKWVVPFDADEFWFAPCFKLGEFLQQTDATVYTARMFNAFPTRERPGLDGLAGPLDLDMSSPLQEKVAVQTHPALWIGMGNHSAVRPGYERDGLRILHLPWRSREQFVRKIRQGARAYRATVFDTGMGGHWRHQDELDDAALDAVWESLLDRSAPPSLGWRPQGPFVECDPSTWRHWDPDGIVNEAVSRHVSWTVQGSVRG